MSEVLPERIAVLALTRGGRDLAKRIVQGLPGAYSGPRSGSVARDIAARWADSGGLVCIMAAGIVVRAIAPLVRHKRTDPAVVVVDERGRYAISLLSGHLGGANLLARRVATITGGEAVITTASDTLGLPAVDLWAAESGLVPDDESAFLRAAARLVNTGCLRVWTAGLSLPLPEGFLPSDTPGEADLVITNRILRSPDDGKPVFRPRNVVAGVGCNRGTPAGEILSAVREALDDAGLSMLSLRELASIDLKRDEPGLAEAARDLRLPVRFFSAQKLNAVPGIRESETVRRTTGARAVAEPAALLATDRRGQLLVRKRKWKNVTVAIAEDPSLS